MTQTLLKLAGHQRKQALSERIGNGSQNVQYLSRKVCFIHIGRELITQPAKLHMGIAVRVNAISTLSSQYLQLFDSQPSELKSVLLTLNKSNQISEHISPEICGESSHTWP